MRLVTLYWEYRGNKKSDKINQSSPAITHDRRVHFYTRLELEFESWLALKLTATPRKRINEQVTNKTSI